MEEAVRKVLHKAINDNIFPGAVVGIAENKKRSIIPLGTIDSTDTAVTNHTIYDVASVTKAIPTSSLALYFLDKNVIQLNNSVTKFLPKFRHRDVTIWHLLTQTVAFGNSSNPLILSQLKDLSAFEIMESIYSADLSFVPGTRYAYTNATSIVLGNVLEAAGGNNLDQLASDIFFIPLGMSHT